LEGVAVKTTPLVPTVSLSIASSTTPTATEVRTLEATLGKIIAQLSQMPEVERVSVAVCWPSGSHPDLDPMIVMDTEQILPINH
jgi:hypothetical protein